jgi:SNF2 family DNA or RNA helicase
MVSTGIRGPFLIVAPLSLVDQWQSEISTWSPDMNCILLHGGTEARDVIINNEFYFQDPFVSRNDAASLKKSNVVKFHILITTFEVATKEMNLLSKINWQVVY